MVFEEVKKDVTCRRGGQPFSVTSGKSSTTTLIIAVSALGETLPLYIIYKGQRLTQELVSNGMEGSKFTINRLIGKIILVQNLFKCSKILCYIV
jgi:hypothetical protein